MCDSSGGDSPDDNVIYLSDRLENKGLIPESSENSPSSSEEKSVSPDIIPSQGKQDDLRAIALALGFLQQSAISIEPNNRLEHNLEQDALDKAHKRWKDRVVIYFSLATVSIILVAAIFVILYPKADSDSKKWATTATTVVLSGLIGYATGQALGKGN